MPAYKDEKRQTWFAQFNYRDYTGKIRSKRKRGFKKKGEAEDYEREFLMKYQGSCNMKFASLKELYYTDIESRLRPDTIYGKKSEIEAHIAPAFDKRIVSEISAADIRKWQNGMKAKRKPNGDPYAETYLRGLHSKLSAIFNYAVRFYGLQQNPCHPAGSMGKKRAPKVKFWTQEQFEKALELEKEPGYRVAMQLEFWGGFRGGECCAFRPLDFQPPRSVKVGATHKRRNGEDSREPPKTDNSYRDVTLPQWLYDEAQHYISRLYGIKPEDRMFYFTVGALNKHIKTAGAKAGVCAYEDFHGHCLRHSHVAMLIEEGWDVFAIAERIGDTPEEVMRTYGHLYPNKQDKMADSLERRKAELLKGKE